MIEDQAAPEYDKGELEKLGAKWLERIRLAEKREDKWAKHAEEAEKMFLAGGDDGDGPDFNILHSNVETIVPSIYNSTGKPDIRPRHNAADKLGKMVADVFERAILAMVDDNKMDVEIEQAAQDIFVAGRGIVRVKFDADVTEQPAVDQMTGQPAMDEAGQPAMQQVVTNERVEYEVVSWRDFRMGPATRWKEVPWVAFRHCISQEVLEKIEDPALKELQDDPGGAVKDDQDVHIWEIWCKDSGKVYFITGESNKVLSVKPDPLHLSGFFPCAAPVQPITATGKMTPICPFQIYRTLADELDMITRRIRGLTDVLKAKGAMAGSTEALDELANADDGEIVALADMENIMAQGGLEKAIMWWPIDRIVQVIRELNAQREETKRAIYEITGISDIIRGQGAASETATAQQIKTQWGSLRIKKMQRMVERMVRELFVLTVEICSQHFSPQTLQKLSGVQIPPEAMQMLQRPFDHYRIDVETDSTVRADLEKNRGEMSEFLQGTASFFATMSPVVAQAPQAAGAVVDMYASFARQFNLGKQAEDALDQLAEIAKEAAANPPPNPEQEAKKAEIEAKMQGEQQKMQLETQKLQQAGAQQQAELQIKQVELQIKQVELQIKREELQLKEAIATTDAAAKMLDLELKDQPHEMAESKGNTNASSF